MTTPDQHARVEQFSSISTEETVKIHLSDVGTDILSNDVSTSVTIPYIEYNSSLNTTFAEVSNSSDCSDYTPVRFSVDLTGQLSVNVSEVPIDCMSEFFVLEA